MAFIIVTMIKAILRDNTIMNWTIRNAVRVIHQYITPLNKLTSLYRVYGTVALDVDNVHFKIYTTADDHIANEIYYNQQYEINEFILIKQLVLSSRYFIDVGANTGIFSIFAATVNTKLCVISFEPHPSNFTRLLTNISINKLSNINIFPNALGSNNMDLEFIIPSNGSISTTASPNEGYTRNFHRMDYKKIEVKQLMLDDVLTKTPINSNDIIKIDVEYYELEVLKGAESILKKNRPMVIVEILRYETLVSQFPEMKGKIQENNDSMVFDFLLNLDYYCYSIGNDGVNYITTLQNQPNRNFLFMPRRLLFDHYPCEKIGKAWN